MNDIASRGTLYGVGVGPGDPELLTLKAARIINACAVVAYPANSEGHSQARTIAAACLHGQQEMAIRLPFTTDRRSTLAAYDAAAEQISALLTSGQDVAVLCEGDPLLYGSFIYLLERLKQHPIHIVPGISSVMASAAAAQVPLAQGEQPLLILPATSDITVLEEALSRNNPVVIMKLGQHRGKILQLLESSGRLSDAVYIEHASRSEQRIVRALEALDLAAPGPYFALIIVRGR